MTGAKISLQTRVVLFCFLGFTAKMTLGSERGFQSTKEAKNPQEANETKEVVVPREVIIDRVMMVGDSSISEYGLAENLGITVGRLISADQSADELLEAERRLTASGKYNDGLSLRMTRGNAYPHQVVTITVTLGSPWYYGFGGEYLQNPRPEYAREDASSHSETNGRTNVYFGSRNWANSGLTFDVEFLNYLWQKQYKVENSAGPNDFHMVLNFNSLAATLVHPNIIGTNVFAGARLGVSHYTFMYHGSYAWAYESAGKKYRFESGYDSRISSIRPSNEFMTGYRLGKLIISGSAGRGFDRDYIRKNNSNVRQTENGVEVPATSFSDFSDEPSRYQVNRDFQVRLGWSDKTGLSLLEPGIVASTVWRRTGDDIVLEKPQVMAGLAYTRVFGYKALTTLGSGQWEYRESSRNQSSVRRKIQLGLRGDYVSESKAVIFVEGYRIGGKRSELEQPGDEGLKLDTRINIGLRYASNSMLYALSAGYGPSVLEENLVTESNLSTVYSRAGVQ
ncbi:MAG: hypothetical protein NTV34_06910 [Proteobacteria bacterium]|nr:hypothetical protein [Pseudomonadota bacterium]